MQNKSEAKAKHWDACSVVGSGPSLSGFDYYALRGEHVIAVNSAIRNVPWCNAWFTADWTWLRDCHELLWGYRGERYAAIQPEMHERFSDLGITWLQRSHDPGLSDDPAVIRLRGPSGYGALGLAYLMVRDGGSITLWGFDLTPGRAENDGRREDLSRYRQWAAEFETCIPDLRRRNIQVRNASTISAITCFERCS